jgi:hypothetical protein
MTGLGQLQPNQNAGGDGSFLRIQASRAMPNNHRDVAARTLATLPTSRIKTSLLNQRSG